VSGDPRSEDFADSADIAGVDFESVDRFLDWQRQLLDDPFDAGNELPGFGGAALEDEPDELDA